MAERRSMHEALDLTPEKIAFIHEAKKETVNKSNEVNPDTTDTKTRDNVTPIQQTVPPNPQGQTQSRKDPNPLSYLQPLIPITTRLSPETATALKRAYLERKLAGELINTQQEIIEEAVHEWLIDRGFVTP